MCFSSVFQQCDGYGIDCVVSPVAAVFIGNYYWSFFNLTFYYYSFFTITHY